MYFKVANSDILKFYPDKKIVIPDNGTYEIRGQVAYCDNNWTADPSKLTRLVIDSKDKVTLKTGDKFNLAAASYSRQSRLMFMVRKSGRIR